MLGGSSHLVSGLVHPSFKWTNPIYPMFNQGYNPLTKWDEPPSAVYTQHKTNSIHLHRANICKHVVNHEPLWLSSKRFRESHGVLVVSMFYNRSMDVRARRNTEV